ncbi:hypothetical protein [Actinomadura violacea]|uniref:Uncharacterized protein n=1 Tax=Actinomadura violacea TaxID=2819934 RepID=A0ABS3S642_9ACTN|nr:hypothetical protein [Actinomadura violacea]MBO2464474.1 hypothetical protein [Actinomadura violacea]
MNSPDTAPRDMTPRDGRCTCTGVGCWHRGRCRAWSGQPHPLTHEPVVLDNAAGWCEPCTPTGRTTNRKTPTEPEPLFS